MIHKKFYSAPSLESVCDAPYEVLCTSTSGDFTSPEYGGQEDEIIF